MKKKLSLILIILFSWVVFHLGIISYDGLTDEIQKSEVAIVFGSKVNKDGSLSPRLKARLDSSIKLYKDSHTEKIFVSGGFGKEGFYEGTIMANYLLSKKVPAKDIIVDNQGFNTIQTAVNLTKRFPNTKSVIVVSQFFHISRAKLAMKKVGITKVYGVHCHYYESRDIYSLIREFPAYYKYLFFN